MSHIFISYSRQDKSAAVSLEAALKRARRKGWLDYHHIVVGGNWHDSIDRAIRAAGAVVVLISPSACTSPNVTYEWSFALGAGIPLIPVLIERSNGIHPRLAVVQYIAALDQPRNWRRVVRACLQNCPAPALKPALKSEPSGLVLNSEPEVPSTPRLMARFERLSSGKVSRIGGDYEIRVWVEGCPSGTQSVQYEILEEGFDEPKWTVKAGPKFSDTITSYGDIFMTAKGKNASGRWRIQTALSAALRRGHRGKLDREIKKALNDIEDN